MFQNKLRRLFNKEIKVPDHSSVTEKDYIGEQFIYRGQIGADLITKNITMDRASLVARLGTTEASILDYY